MMKRRIVIAREDESPRGEWTRTMIRKGEEKNEGVDGSISIVDGRLQRNSIGGGAIKTLFGQVGRLPASHAANGATAETRAPRSNPLEQHLPTEP